MADKVMTGALGIIKRNGTPIGRMRNIRWTENLTDATVQGIGTIFVIEAPVVGHGGTLSCSFYSVDFNTGIPDSIRRDVQTDQEFEDNVLLRDAIQVDVFKKIEDAIDPDTLLKTAKATPFAIIRGLLLQSDGSDVTEGAISGRDQTFRFLNPVLYPS